MRTGWDMDPFAASPPSKKAFRMRAICHSESMRHNSKSSLPCWIGTNSLPTITLAKERYEKEEAERKAQAAEQKAMEDRRKMEEEEQKVEEERRMRKNVEREATEEIC